MKFKNIKKATKFAVEKFTFQKDKFDDEVAKERLKVCESCVYLLKPAYVCSQCGCLMKLKVTWKEAECPAGKW